MTPPVEDHTSDRAGQMAKEVMGIDRTGSPSDGPTLVTTMIDRPGCLILPPGQTHPGARTAHQHR